MLNQFGLYRDTTGYRDRDMATRGVLKSTNEILGGVGTNPSNMGGAVGGMSANETTDGLAATSGYGTREQQANQRMAHLQSTGRMNRPSGSTDDYGRTGYAGSATGTGSVAAGSTAMGGGGRWPDYYSYNERRSYYGQPSRYDQRSYNNPYNTWY